MEFENKALRTFGSKRDEVTGDYNKLYNEILHNLFSLSNVRMIKSRRMRCVGHAACTLQKKIAYKDSVAKPEEKHRLKDLVMCGSTISKWILRKYGFICSIM
jgi:hypothetical protein